MALPHTTVDAVPQLMGRWQDAVTGWSRGDGRLSCSWPGRAGRRTELARCAAKGQAGGGLRARQQAGKGWCGGSIRRIASPFSHLTRRGAWAEGGWKERLAWHVPGQPDQRWRDAVGARAGGCVGQRARPERLQALCSLCLPWPFLWALGRPPSGGGQCGSFLTSASAGLLPSPRVWLLPWFPSWRRRAWRLPQQQQAWLPGGGGRGGGLGLGHGTGGKQAERQGGDDGLGVHDGSFSVINLAILPTPLGGLSRLGPVRELVDSTPLGFWRMT